MTKKFCFSIHTFVATAVFICSSCSSSLALADTLQQVLATAYQYNPELASARAQLRVIDESVSQALSGWRPDIQATADAGTSQQKVSGGSIVAQDDTLSPRSVSLNVTQPVFSGFRTVSQTESAEASVQAGRAALKSAEQKLFLQTAQAYLDVLQAQEILDLQKSQQDVLRQKQKEIEDRLKIKELTKTDLSQAEARLNTAIVSSLRAEANLANARTTLSRLTGQVPGVLEPVNLPLVMPQTQEVAVEMALQKNPNIVETQFKSKAAKADIDAVKGALFPQVDLVGRASRSEEQNLTFPNRQNDATVLARLTLPLYKSGTDYAKTRAAQQTAAQRRFDLEDVRSKTREQATQAWQELTTTRAATVQQASVVLAEESALSGVKMEAKFGSRTTLDVLNAEQELLDAKINAAKARHDEALASLQMKSVVGELTADVLKLPVKQYDPNINYNAVRNKWVGFSAGN